MSSGPALEELPPAVRARVVAITADVLPDVVRLPPALRRVASFAPARRARLGAGAIAGALADDDLRERVGVQVEARVAGRPAPAPEDDPADRAAYAWLARPEEWTATLEAATREAAERAPAPEREAAALEQVRGRLERAEQALREARAAHKAQVEEQKAEIASLRRKLGEARTAERVARQDLEEGVRAAEEARAAAEALAASQDKELRRLRTQVTQLEAEGSAGRRTAKEDREDATLRARVLLDTVLQAAGGLQRELGLPPVTGGPGDRVEAAVAESGETARAAAVPSGRSGPAMLEQYLAMPRARLLVDGYNVSKSAWPASTLEAQRTRLVTALAPLVARTGAETTVVFDAAASTSRHAVPAPRGVRVLFSPPGVIADDVIRQLVAAEPTGRVVVVVTSDQGIVADVVRDGARAVPAEALLALLGVAG